MPTAACGPPRCWCIPALPFFPAPAEPTSASWAPRSRWASCARGIAYILYFKLIEEVGPTSALTVTFLNPLFGILWGALFLGEVVGWHTVAGAAIVITGTALVTGFLPRSCAVLWCRPPPNGKKAHGVARQLRSHCRRATAAADVLAFHGRDAEGVAEQVDAGRIRKGVVLEACRCAGVALARKPRCGSGPTAR